jgi:hypothetical protein
MPMRGGGGHDQNGNAASCRPLLGAYSGKLGGGGGWHIQKSTQPRAGPQPLPHTTPLPSGVKLLVARNPLRRELARQRDISYGPSGAWNRGAAFRISEMSGQSHPPKPPVLGRIRLKGAAPSRELRPISFSAPSFVEVRLSWFVFQLPNTTRVHV